MKCRPEVKEAIDGAFKKLNCKNIHDFANKVGYHRSSIARWIKGGPIKDCSLEVFRSVSK